MTPAHPSLPTWAPFICPYGGGRRPVADPLWPANHAAGETSTAPSRPMAASPTVAPARRRLRQGFHLPTTLGGTAASAFGVAARTWTFGTLYLELVERYLDYFLPKQATAGNATAGGPPMTSPATTGGATGMLSSFRGGHAAAVLSNLAPSHGPLANVLHLGPAASPSPVHTTTGLPMGYERHLCTS